MARNRAGQIPPRQRFSSTQSGEHCVRTTFFCGAP